MGAEWGGEAATDEVLTISAEIDRALHVFMDKQPLGEFYELMRYELGWRTPDVSPQPRVRAVLAVLACQACGGSLEAAMPVAMAVALLHNFARIQGDMERRREVNNGRPALWSVWGTPQAMNAGDGMHALAKMALLECRNKVSAGTILRLEEELDESCLRMCETVHQQLLEHDAERAGELAARKSALLFGCAAYAGCCLAGGDERRRQAMRQFGERIGSAAGWLSRSPARARELYDEALTALSSLGLSVAEGNRLHAFSRYVVKAEI